MDKMLPAYVFMAQIFDFINVHSSSHIVLIHELLDLMTFVSNYTDYISR